MPLPSRLIRLKNLQTSSSKPARYYGLTFRDTVNSFQKLQPSS